MTESKHFLDLIKGYRIAVNNNGYPVTKAKLALTYDLQVAVKQGRFSSSVIEFLYRRILSL